MTTFEKLEEILACVQTDPGNRGLARDPVDNLFTATAGDFERACCSLLSQPDVALDVDTGFFIPTAAPPAYETDGPLGAAFLIRALAGRLTQVAVFCPEPCARAIHAGLESTGLELDFREVENGRSFVIQYPGYPGYPCTTLLALELVGRAVDGRYYSMRGRDITEFAFNRNVGYLLPKETDSPITIGIGDGGNEIGMGNIPHETIVKNIPNGDLIHCRVPTDHLIVAGVSNWGAYALAAGVYVLRNEKPPANLFDPDYERKILEIMVEAGPLVDGVTGKQEATVDGLTWDEYVKPLIRMREILES
jgi:hypothetical protein